MGEGDAEKTRFRKVAPAGDKRGPTTHVAPDFLRSIYIYVNEAPNSDAQGGSVTFVGDKGGKLFAVLKHTYFPAGTWHADVLATLKLANLEAKFPPDIDQSLVDTLNSHADKDLVIAWKGRGKNKEEALKGLKAIDRQLRASAGRRIRIVVSYTKVKSGNPRSLPESLPLTEGDNTVLKDPELARMYLLFVEHFGKIKPDFSLAEGGLTADEIEQVEDGRPDIIAITNLFVQAFAEFEAAKPLAAAPVPDLENFQAMTEAIFYQKAAKNDLARRNMLAIGIGSLLERQGDKLQSTSDIGVVHRKTQGTPTLLYDRHGIEIRGGATPLDKEFRAYDMEKIERDTGIPHMSLEVEDEALYLFLRNLEQTFGDSFRDVEALAASLYKHTLLITFEMKRINGGRIARRIIDFAPVVIAFFVAHAIAAQLVKRGHPAAAAFSALIVGAGLILGIDFTLMQMGLVLAAGRHFHRIEELHREAGDTEPKITGLSAKHLRRGSDLLIQAMEEFIALGVIIVGTLGLGIGGRALRRGIERQGEARSKLTIENDQATKIESVAPEKRPKIIEEKAETRGLEKDGGRKAKPPPKQPVEAEGPLVGEGRQGKIPKERTEGAIEVEAGREPLSKEQAFGLVDRVRERVDGMDPLGETIPKRGDGKGTVAIVEGEGGARTAVGLNSSLVSEASKRLGRDAFPQMKANGLLGKAKAFGQGEGQVLTHAEAHALLRAKELGRLGRVVRLFVDRETCANCRKYLPDLMKHLGIEKLTIIMKNGKTLELSPTE